MAVPLPLAHLTLKAAAHLAAGRSASLGLINAAAASLTRRTMHTMLLRNLTLAAFSLGAPLTLGLAFVGQGPPEPATTASTHAVPPNKNQETSDPPSQLDLAAESNLPGASPIAFTPRVEPDETNSDPLTPKLDLRYSSARIINNLTRSGIASFGTVIRRFNQEALILTSAHTLIPAGVDNPAPDAPMFRGAFGVHLLQNVTEDGNITSMSHEGVLVSYDALSDLALLRIVARVPAFPVRIEPASWQYRLGATYFGVVWPGQLPLPVATVYRGTREGAFEGRKTDWLECEEVPQSGPQPILVGGGLFNKDRMLIGVCNYEDPVSKTKIYANLTKIHDFLSKAGVQFDERMPSRSNTLPGLTIPSVHADSPSPYPPRSLPQADTPAISPIPDAQGSVPSTSVDEPNHAEPGEPTPAQRRRLSMSTVRIRVNYPTVETHGSGTVIRSRAGRDMILTDSSLFAPGRNLPPGQEPHIWVEFPTIIVRTIDRHKSAAIASAPAIAIGSSPVSGLTLLTISPWCQPFSAAIAPAEEPMEIGQALWAFDRHQGDAELRGRPTQIERIRQSSQGQGFDELVCSGPSPLSETGGGLYRGDRLVGICTGTVDGKSIFAGPAAIHEFMQLRGMKHFDPIMYDPPGWDAHPSAHPSAPPEPNSPIPSEDAEKPARDDQERRLQEVESKLDRVLKLLEARQSDPSAK